MSVEENKSSCNTSDNNKMISKFNCYFYSAKHMLLV